MDYADFLNNLKQQEVSYYDELVRKYNLLDARRSEFQPRDETEYDKWYAYRDQLDQISSDYDVHDYSDTIIKYGEDKYKTRLNNRIDEHIEKLAKSIKREVGNVISIKDLGNNEYHLEGNNAICDITVTPIKSSSSGNIVKTRIKVSNVVKRDVPLDYIPEKEDNEWIKEWKENEFQEYVKINKEFWEKYYELEEKREEKRDALREAIRNYSNEYGTNPQTDNSLRTRYYTHYIDQTVEAANKEYIAADQAVRELRDRNSFFYTEGRGNGYEDRFRKAINNHFKTLQAKVEGKIGEIVKIFPLSNNGADYHFEGTTGDCDVEVILAGGYNIQRLHTRWIIKNVKSKEVR